MHVFLTGATGFVGHHILQELIRRGHSVRCLVREGSLDKLPVGEGEYTVVDSSKETIVAGEGPAEKPPQGRVEVVYGDVTDIESIEGDLSGCDAVIHLVGIIDEDRHNGVTYERVHVRGTRHVVEEARAAGVQRFVHMSANDARSDPDASRYHSTKFEAEEIVREAGFTHAVIFRPSIIFGDPGEGRPEFAKRLADTLVGPFPLLPVLGDGQYKLQPIHIHEAAAIFVKAAELDTSEGKATAYCLGGPEVLTFDEVLDRIAIAMQGKPKPKLHLPLWLSKLMVNTFGAMGLMPISPAQFQMLIEGNTCDDDTFREIFGPATTSFQSDNLTYLRRDQK